MKIIIRFLLRNIKEKKFRTFLIVFSIILSTALLFASLSISTTVEDMQIKRLKKYYGSADIMIYPDDDSTSQFLSSKKAKKHIDKTDYIIGTFIGSARYKYNNLENITVNLHGYNLRELQTMNPINIEEKDKLMPFTGKKIIIGRDTARKYNLSLGSTINLTINGYKHHYTVSAIASAQGIFGSSQGGQSIIAVVPKNKLTTLYNPIGKNTRIYIKPGSDVDVESLIKNMSRDYKRYMVTQTITEKEISEYTGRTTTPFFIMLLLVIFVSIFIIYTSFKVITMERLPVIGTFRSIGATKKITDLILLSESIIYGIVGGIVGLGLGFIILYYMMRTLSYNPYSQTSLEVEMIFTINQILVSFLFSIILSISGSIIPIIKVSKISIKDIVLNNFNNYIKPDNKKNIIGLILLLTAIVLPYIAVNKIAMLFYFTSIILIGIVIVLLIPIVTNFFIFVFEKIYKYIFGNEGILAVKNLRGNKNILNNIVLLSLGISSVLLINIISYSV
ncbi:MAG: ABC transporter permease [bacterium]